jgi:hypothetical protein
MIGAIANVAALDSGASGSDRIQIRFSSSNAGSGIILDAGATQASMVSVNDSWPVGSPRRAAISYKSDQFSFAVGGGSAITDMAGTVPTVNRLVIGTGPGYQSSFNGTISRITYYPRVIDVQQASA